MGLTCTKIEFTSDPPELSSLLERASVIAGLRIRKDRDDRVYLPFLFIEDASVLMQGNHITLTYNMGSVPFVVKVVAAACGEYGGTVALGNHVDLLSNGVSKLSTFHLVKEYVSRYAIYAVTGLPFLIFMLAVLFGLGFLVYFGVSKILLLMK